MYLCALSFIIVFFLFVCVFFFNDKHDKGRIIQLIIRDTFHVRQTVV